MKRMIAVIGVLLMALLLAGCAPEEVLPEDGEPGYASCPIDLATDGRRLFLLRRGKTMPSWSSTYTAYEVTGGAMRRIAGGRNADDFAVADGTLYIASHTVDWLKPVQVSAEIDGYDVATGARVLHVSRRDEKTVNPDRYAFHLAGERVIRQCRSYSVQDGHRLEFAFVDAQGAAGEVFHARGWESALVTDTYIASWEHAGAEVYILDLATLQTYTLPLTWQATGRDGDGLAPMLPRGVLLEGTLYYCAEDGVHALAPDSLQDSLFAPVTAPEYFYVTGGRLYTVADDGLLTTFDLTTGEAVPTGVALTKADRYVIAGEHVYILQEGGCRIAPLTEVE